MKATRSDKLFFLKILLLSSILCLGAIKPSAFQSKEIKAAMSTVVVEKFPGGFPVNLIFKTILVK